jgi:hypothetical protein
MSRSTRLLVSVTAATATVALLWPADAFAQRARARARVVPSRIVRTYVYRPYYYAPYYNRFFFGYGLGPYGLYPSYWYPQYPRYRYAYDEASLRIQVTPREAQVYVDGYYVGMVDSFDGTFQRLHLSPGEHVIEIYLEGYRTIRETMRFQPREGYQLRRAMEPLGASDPAAERPRPDPSGRRASPSYPGDSMRERPAEPREPRPGSMRGEQSGSIAIRVQPAGATVLIDGEKWQAPEGSEALVVHLSEGSHRVEVQKSGYRTFTTEFRVRRGETVPLNISLRAQ